MIAARLLAAVGSLVLAATVLAAGAEAVSVPVRFAAEDFYTPPDPLPHGQPGDIIRSEPASTALAALGSATRIMYRSTDTYGKPIAVTGMVFDPSADWAGAGERPLVGFTVGTHGQGDQCAPSKLLSGVVHYSPLLDLMSEYESAFIGGLLSQGVAVVVTDCEGLGTPTVHTWNNRAAEAHANIDAVRAAQRLAGTGIPADGPVGFAGYSQGGGAAAAAAELVDSYGPEMDVVGSYAGAPPVDPRAMGYIDGTALMGVMGYYINGLVAANPKAAPVIDAALNDAGKQLLAEVREQCVVETIVAYRDRLSSEFTASGRPIPDVLAEHLVTRRAMEHDQIGNLTPTAPVLLTTGDNDDIVPADGVRNLAAAWCAAGATVELYEVPLAMLLPGTSVGHIADAPVGYGAKARTWLLDRFAGKPAPTTCAN